MQAAIGASVRAAAIVVSSGIQNVGNSPLFNNEPKQQDMLTHLKMLQAPAEAVDAFLVRAKASGKVSGLDSGGVAQVLEYFCSRKPCATGETPSPLELAVEGIGVVSVAFGEEVKSSAPL
jgi:hypothetical protein